MHHHFHILLRLPEKQDTHTISWVFYLICNLPKYLESYWSSKSQRQTLQLRYSDCWNLTSYPTLSLSNTSLTLSKKKDGRLATSWGGVFVRKKSFSKCSIISSSSSGSGKARVGSEWSASSISFVTALLRERRWLCKKYPLGS